MKTKRESQPKIKMDDIYRNDASKLLFWKLAVVYHLLTSADGNVRVANVRVSEPNENTKLLRRSVKHLFPIEVRQEQCHKTQIDPSAEQQVDTNRRPC